MNKLLLSSLLACCLLAVSCETIIEFNQKQTAPLMVLEAYPMPDSVLYVRLSESRFFLNWTDDFKLIEGATIWLSVNQKQREQLTYVDRGIYKARYRPKAGDELRIEASHPSYKAIWAETNVPESMPTTSFLDSTFTEEVFDPYAYQEVENDIHEWYNVYVAHRFRFTFQDDPNTADYYQLYAFSYRDLAYNNSEADGPYFGEGTKCTSAKVSSDKAFLDLKVEDGQVSIFSDELFNGKELTVEVEFMFQDSYIKSVIGDSIWAAVGTRQLIEVSIDRVSYDYYCFMQQYNLTELDELLSVFSEPYQVYNNVHNGIGIFAGISPNKKEWQQVILSPAAQLNKKYVPEVLY